jgi:hypothetical protein
MDDKDKTIKRLQKEIIILKNDNIKNLIDYNKKIDVIRDEHKKELVKLKLSFKNKS